ncbi:MAG: hypothetical protein HY534_03660 [Chloroflexi bacterium]|nr:hypothetical protein [Chloroflexota bacterium]
MNRGRIGQGYFPAVRTALEEHPALGLVALGWLSLAVLALVLSGTFVVLVAAARTPLVEFLAGHAYLYVALVAHVTFALNIWLLSFVAALWVIVAARMGHALPVRPARLGLLSSWSGALLLAAVPLVGQGQPILADYVPTLIHPLFFLGYGAYFAGLGLSAVLFLFAMRRHTGPVPVEARALEVSAASYLLAVASYAAVVARGDAVDFASQVWGGGHLLQVGNGAALVGAWWIMLDAPPRWADRLVRTSFGSVAASLLAVGLYSFFAVSWDLLTPLFWAGLAVPLVTAWLVVAWTVLRQSVAGTIQRGSTGPLVFSLALFSLGGLIALTGMDNDTRVTAHYHGVVGAVTLIFMALTFRFCASLGIAGAWRRVARWQPAGYGMGLLLLVAGMFWAGSLGATRKTFELMPDHPALLAAGALIGLGAMVTLIAGGAFLLSVGPALLEALARRVSVQGAYTTRVRAGPAVVGNLSDGSA